MSKIPQIQFVINNGSFKEIISVAKRIIKNKVNYLLYSSEYKKFINYYNKKDNKSAINIGKKIENKNKLNGEFLRMMAISYRNTSNPEKGTKYMKKNLDLYLGNENNINLKFKNMYNTESNYAYLGGTGNLGTINHVDINNPNNVYITMILPVNRNTESGIIREVFFNEHIRVKSNSLKETTPALVSKEYINNNLLLLTFEKKGITLGRNRNPKEVVKLSNLISNSLTYDEVSNLLKRTTDRKIYISPLKMHEKSVHIRYIKEMKHIYKKLIKTYDLSPIVNKIEFLVMDSKIYNKIIPKDNYVLCHGDFGTSNILYDTNDKNYYLIDWENYGLGLRGNDLADYLIYTNCNFEKIKLEYMPLLFNVNRNYSLEKFFFIYKLLNHWISKLTKTNAILNIKTDILPALNYLEQLSRKII